MSCVPYQIHFTQWMTSNILITLTVLGTLSDTLHTVDDVQHNIRIITLTVSGTQYKLRNYHESALPFIREVRLSMNCN
jgi:hypothetical protein